MPVLLRYVCPSMTMEKKTCAIILTWCCRLHMSHCGSSTLHFLSCVMTRGSATYRTHVETSSFFIEWQGEVWGALTTRFQENKGRWGLQLACPLRELTNNIYSDVSWMNTVSVLSYPVDGLPKSASSRNTTVPSSASRTMPAFPGMKFFWGGVMVLNIFRVAKRARHRSDDVATLMQSSPIR